METSNGNDFNDSESQIHEELRKRMRFIINLKLIQILGENKQLKENVSNEEIPEIVNKNERTHSLEESNSVKKVDLFDCGICLESLPVINSISFGCDHQFCYDCISDYLSTQITEGTIETFKCPYPKCDAKASEALIEQMVPPPIYERYLKLQIQNGVSAMDDIFYCPNSECQTIVECEVDVGIGSCHACGHTFCTSCLQEYHGTSDCYLNEHEKREMLLKFQIQKRAEDQEIARQLRIAEEKRKALEEEKRKRVEQENASQSFINITYKKCPGCQSDVEKISGCDHMQCTKCKRHFCWVCLLLYTHDHQYHVCRT